MPTHLCPQIIRALLFLVSVTLVVDKETRPQVNVICFKSQIEDKFIVIPP
ncbi:Uncharacterised protein [Salmonella enterica subsp. enterica serovar Typhi]|nr:Uncharacterised protein [Salmonella enterica subsp. enterica serovar Typhi]